MPRERGGVGEGAASQLAPSDATTTTVVGGIVAAKRRRRNMSLDNRMDGMQLTRIGGRQRWETLDDERAKYNLPICFHLWHFGRGLITGHTRRPNK